MATKRKPAPQFADIGDIQEYISKAKVAWVQCRTKGHNMTDHDVKFNEEENEFKVILRCSRCYTKRSETVDATTGEVLSSKYHDHPEDYLLPRGTGRLGKDGRGLLRVTHFQNRVQGKRDMTELAAVARRTRKKAS